VRGRSCGRRLDTHACVSCTRSAERDTTLFRELGRRTVLS
jgi:hypothetical protein